MKKQNSKKLQVQKVEKQKNDALNLSKSKSMNDLQSPDLNIDDLNYHKNNKFFQTSNKGIQLTQSPTVINSPEINDRQKSQVKLSCNSKSFILQLLNDLYQKTQYPMKYSVLIMKEKVQQLSDEHVKKLFDGDEMASLSNFVQQDLTFNSHEQLSSVLNALQKLGCKFDFFKICFNFSDTFIPENITKEQWKIIFDLSYLNRMESNELVFATKSINENDIQQYGKLDFFKLDELTTEPINDLHDVIYINKHEMTNILRFYKIRNIVYTSNVKRFISFMYPQYLLTVNLSNVHVMNMEMCVNIQNIISWNTLYKTSYMKGLTNLKRFCSFNDRVRGNTSLLVVLMSQAKLEYVHIFRGCRVYTGLVLKANISNLRYFCAHTHIASLLILDLTDEYPEQLRVCKHILLMQEAKTEIIGPAKKVAAMKLQLQ